jgi:hypothetical protein
LSSLSARINPSDWSDATFCSWRKLKHDYLDAFHQPRLDLLVYIIATRLSPPYLPRIDRVLERIDAGPLGSARSSFARESWWRTMFAADWRALAAKPLTWSNDWRTDAIAGTCDCPTFASHRLVNCPL